MKIGICGYLTGKNADGEEFDFLPAARAAGFDYIELPLSALAGLSEAEFTRVCEALAQNSLPCEACNLFFPAGLRLTGPRVLVEEVRDYLELALARAAAVGARVVVFGSGGARRVPEGFRVEQAWEQLAWMLRQAGDIAAGLGIRIAIEPLNRGETNIINTGAEGYSLAKMVDHPNVGLLLDIYHMVKEGEDFSIAQAAREVLAHAHFAEPTARAFPMAVDETGRAFFGALGKAGYRGRVSLEAGYRDFQGEARAAVQVMRELAKQAGSMG